MMRHAGLGDNELDRRLPLASGRGRDALAHHVRQCPAPLPVPTTRGNPLTTCASRTNLVDLNDVREASHGQVETGETTAAKMQVRPSRDDWQMGMAQCLSAPRRRTGVSDGISAVWVRVLHATAVLRYRRGAGGLQVWLFFSLVIAITSILARANLRLRRSRRRLHAVSLQ